MSKRNRDNPAKRRPLPWQKRTAATVRSRPPVACLECYDTHACPNCGNHPVFRDGCTVCGSTGKCPYCDVK